MRFASPTAVHENKHINTHKICNNNNYVRTDEHEYWGYVYHIIIKPSRGRPFVIFVSHRNSYQLSRICIRYYIGGQWYSTQ